MGRNQPLGERPIRILFVEDNPADVRLLEETLRDAAWPFTSAIARDGLSALRYLRREGEFVDAPRPDLVLLDLNLPGMDGRKVLAEVRSDPRLNGIPVVIFTGSSADEDVALAYNFRAEGYLRKPVRLADFRALVDRLAI
jgi:two-component system, chemotaxis family, response regulator Rcp1